MLPTLGKPASELENRAVDLFRTLEIFVFTTRAITNSCDREHAAVWSALLSSASMDMVMTCTSYRVYYKAFAEFEEDLHRHIHLENNVLFPKALDACD